MAIEKTLGGDRIGSGNKMKVQMHNYERSTHNLSRVWRSSMAPGVLYPFFVEIGLNGDTWEIDLETKVRTLPTTGPLFGSFKCQLEIYECPIRLYVGMLHNNALSIGMNMAQVLLPKIQIPMMPLTQAVKYTAAKQTRLDHINVNTSSLPHYFGINGTFDSQTKQYNGVPFLAYWDIVKNYHVNKQETNAYVIGPKLIITNQDYIHVCWVGDEVKINVNNTESEYYQRRRTTTSGPAGTVPVAVRGRGQIGGYNINNQYGTMINVNSKASSWGNGTYSIDNGNTSLNQTNPMKVGQYLTINIGELPEDITKNQNQLEQIQIGLYSTMQQEGVPGTWINIGPGQNFEIVNLWPNGNTGPNTTMTIQLKTLDNIASAYIQGESINVRGIKTTAVTLTYPTLEMNLMAFPITNLDNARYKVLSNCKLGQNVIINNSTGDTANIINFMPYSVCASNFSSAKIPFNNAPMNGLAIKTYLSDVNNNWLQTEWVEKIASNSTIDVTQGLTMDALNFAQKVYNMLNRVAVAGGTWEDWQEAIYGEEALRRAESPIYCGGMSTEVVFDEVVSSARFENGSETSPLGTLGGRGSNTGKKGGRMKINIKEPSILIGLISLTPRLDYSQGDKWYMTNLNSIDDLHKPELDQIGFQNMPVSQITSLATTAEQLSIGKQPAWINYMTAVNECHGDFADEQKAMWMTLNRRYEIEQVGNEISVNDVTTYIDPQKYNYAFADSELTAQNFWVQVGIEAIARRKMSAKIIPNL